MRIGLALIWRGVKWLLGAIMAFSASFAGLAFVSVLFPTDGRVQSPIADSPIYLCAGFVHTDFAVPLALARSEDFGPVAPFVSENYPEDTFVLLGWGDYRFFTEVPTFADLRPGIALGALTGKHATAVRVQLIRQNSLRDFCRKLPLDRKGQAAIAAHIRETLAAPQTILPASEIGLTYLAANRRYGLFQTCNDWTSEALRKAGLPAARWHAPFAFSVTWPLSESIDETSLES